MSSKGVKVGFKDKIGLEKELQIKSCPTKSGKTIELDDVTFHQCVNLTSCFMLWWIADQQFMLKNFTISLENFKSRRIHMMITSTFSHIDIGHLISNMIGLYFFGVNVCIHAS
ncbi:hypothetical protein LOK49_LG05G03593 [Camellia lanceoleosa]|uniref:Uncharacterized protein n=1 Tax=Camellia lanceoleosa TaxID=1840588 RepID=A0ACC0HNW9_9ERIC|nr:hypothetical protein LOK49_LG05G03593 [Camellia lanceoleosa]